MSEDFAPTRPHPKRWPRRAVAERIDVPYDVDAAGKPLTVRMEVLTCGHRLPIATNYAGHGKNVAIQQASRFCPKCPVEGESE